MCSYTFTSQCLSKKKKKNQKTLALLPYFIIVSATKKATGQLTTMNKHLIPVFAAGVFQSSPDTIMKWTLEQRKLT